MDRYVDLAILKDVLLGDDSGYHRKAEQAFNSIFNDLVEKREKGFFFKDIVKSYFGDQCVEGSEQYNQVYQEVSDIWELNKKIKDYDYIDRKKLKKDFILADDRKDYLNSINKKEEKPVEDTVEYNSNKEGLVSKVGRFFSNIGKKAKRYLCPKPAIALPGGGSVAASDLGIDCYMDEDTNFGNSVKPKKDFFGLDEEKQPEKPILSEDEQKLEQKFEFVKSAFKDIGENLDNVVLKGEEHKVISNINTIFYEVADYDVAVVKKYLIHIHDWAEESFNQEIKEGLDYQHVLAFHNQVNEEYRYYRGKTGVELLREEASNLVSMASGILIHSVLPERYNKLSLKFKEHSLTLCENFYQGPDKQEILNFLEEPTEESIKVVLDNEDILKQGRNETDEVYWSRLLWLSTQNVFDKLCSILAKEDRTYLLSLGKTKAELYMDIKRKIQETAKDVIDATEIEFTKVKLDVIRDSIVKRKDFERHQIDATIRLATELYASTSMECYDMSYKPKGKRYLFELAKITSFMLEEYVDRIKASSMSIKEKDEQIGRLLDHVGLIDELLRPHFMDDGLKKRSLEDDVKEEADKLAKTIRELGAADNKIHFLENRIENQKAEISSILEELESTKLQYISASNKSEESEKRHMDYKKMKKRNEILGHNNEVARKEIDVLKKESDELHKKWFRFGKIVDYVGKAAIVLLTGALVYNIIDLTIKEESHEPVKKIERSVEDYQTFASGFEERIDAVKEAGKTMVLESPIYKTADQILASMIARGEDPEVIKLRYTTLKGIEEKRDKDLNNAVETACTIKDMGLDIGSKVLDHILMDKNESASIGSTLAERIKKLKDKEKKSVEAIYASSGDEERKVASDNAKMIMAELREAENELDKLV